MSWWCPSFHLFVSQHFSVSRLSSLTSVSACLFLFLSEMGQRKGRKACRVGKKKAGRSLANPTTSDFFFCCLLFLFLSFLRSRHFLPSHTMLSHRRTAFLLLPSSVLVPSSAFCLFQAFSFTSSVTPSSLRFPFFLPKILLHFFFCLFAVLPSHLLFPQASLCYVLFTVLPISHSFRLFLIASRAFFHTHLLSSSLFLPLVLSLYFVAFLCIALPSQDSLF